MKKIALVSFLLIAVSCSVFKKSVTLTDPVRINVFAITMPVSEQIPGTKRLFRGADGKNHRFTLTDLQTEKGETVSVYLIDEVYYKLQEQVYLTDIDLRLKKSGDKVTGYVFSAQSLENASVIPKSEMKKFGKSDKAVVRTFQNDRKYIVWSWVGTKVTFLVGRNGGIDFSSLDNIDNAEVLTQKKDNQVTIPEKKSLPTDTLRAKPGRKWE